MKELTLLEQMIIAVIIGLRDHAYGVSILKGVEKLTGKKIIGSRRCYV